MSKAKAFLFDLNGTMVDDMDYHLKAWQGILNGDLNAGLAYNEVKKEMYGKNSEVLIRVFGPEKFNEEEMDVISIEKEKRYQKEFLPHLKLIDGLDNLLAKAKEQGIKMAIGSAAIPFNIDFVLDNLHIRNYFPVVVSANDVVISKPDPETFIKAAQLLGVAPGDCIVFEDAPKGVEAAQNAGMRVVVLTTMHEEEEFQQYKNVVGYIKNYNDPLIKELL